VELSVWEPLEHEVTTAANTTPMMNNRERGWGIKEPPRYAPTPVLQRWVPGV